MKMYFEDLDNDMSWLTQTPRLESEQPVFDVDAKFIEEELLEEDNVVNNIVSLEEDVESSRKHVLYDNVVAEDISGDEVADRG